MPDPATPAAPTPSPAPPAPPKDAPKHGADAKILSPQDVAKVLDPTPAERPKPPKPAPPQTKEERDKERAKFDDRTFRIVSDAVGARRKGDVVQGHEFGEHADVKRLLKIGAIAEVKED